MREIPATMSRRTALILSAVMVVAFGLIVTGLAIGQIVVAGLGGMVVVVMWFVLLANRRRGS